MSMTQALLSPMLPSSALLVATLSGDAARQSLINFASKYPIIRQIIAFCSRGPFRLKTVLGALLALEGLRRVNRVLGIMASNSWRWAAAPGWNWPTEIAVVTGGSGGIGREIVVKLAAEGVHVAVLDIQALPESLQGMPLVHFYECDLCSSESVADAAEAVRRELGHPSILVNNAGIARLRTILDISEEDLRRVLGVNCISLWLTTKQFLPRMVELNKGHIVTVASIASFVALAKSADYAASKAAALSFHEALGSELKYFYKAPNILTTVAHPYYARTSILGSARKHLEEAGTVFVSPEEVADRIVKQILSRRGGQLIIPESLTMLASIRTWPVWLQELVRGRSNKKKADWED